MHARDLTMCLSGVWLCVGTVCDCLALAGLCGSVPTRCRKSGTTRRCLAACCFGKQGAPNGPQSRSYRMATRPPASQSGLLCGSRYHHAVLYLVYTLLIHAPRRISMLLCSTNLHHHLLRSRYRRPPHLHHRQWHQCQRQPTRRRRPPSQ